MRILGVDPGLASTGWGLVEGDGRRLKYLAHGTIVTKSKDPMPERLLKIYLSIQEVIARYQPRGIALETLYFMKNVTSALPVAQARGVVILAGAEKALTYSEFSPNEIKQSVVGNGRADKKQVESMVRLLLGEIPGKSTDHAMDALAAAVCSIHQGGLSCLTV